MGVSGWTLIDMHPLHGIQGAGLNAVPAAHADILEYKRRLKGAVYLFHDLVCACLCR